MTGHRAFWCGVVVIWATCAAAAAENPPAPTADQFLITKVRLLPKPGAAATLAGGRITGSNEGPTTAFVELARIDPAPAADGWVEVSVPKSQVYRYVKVESPHALALAEVEFFNPAGKIAGKGFGTSVPKDKSAVSFEKALDGNPATFFEAATDNSYVGIDLGAQAQAPTPRFKPQTGALADGQKVELSTWPSGATIHFTTDGSVPTATSAVYSGPISISGKMSIAAIASKPGLADSDIAVGSYQVGGAAAAEAQIRSYHIGNSLTDTVNGFLETVANSAGHNLYYIRKTIPGCGIKGNFEACGKGFASPEGWCNDYNLVFEKHIDHFFLQPFPNPPGLESDGEFGGKFMELARKQNPKVTLWLYAQWPAWDSWKNDAHCTGAGWMKPQWFPPNRKPADWEEAMSNKMLYYLDLKKIWDKQLEARGEPTTRLVPGGPALVRLKKEIEAGKVPGMTHFHDAIFADGIHLTRQGRYLVALVHYGCIYQQNPSGLVTYANGGLTKEQAAIFQRIAWEAVTSEPLTGVKP